MKGQPVDAGDVEAFLSSEGLFAGKTLLALKNENSDLLVKVKPCNMEFLDNVFNRLIWDLYGELGLAYRPYDSRYMVFLNHEIFFCKNVEERFMTLIGGQKEYSVAGGRIVEETPFSLANAVFFFAKPVEMVRNALSVSAAALRISEGLSSLPQHHIRSLAFWGCNRDVKASDAADVASRALDGALASMRYSLMSTAAASLGIGLRGAAPLNLTARLLDDASRQDVGELCRRHGYFSMCPYDVSRPFLEEDPTLASTLLNVPVPTQPHYIVREDAKLCCGMHLAVLRRCYLAFGVESGLGADVFFLAPSELRTWESDELASVSLARRKRYESAAPLARRIAFQGGVPVSEEAQVSEVGGVSAGAKTSSVGKLLMIESFEDPVQVCKGDVIASRHLSPELVVYYGLCSAVISETGGRLAHAAIVALEKGIPCIIQVDGFDRLKTGMRVRVDGGTGKITILDAI